MPDNPDSTTSSSSVLRPRARILKILGDELISSDQVALIELIKNSYDADATAVDVLFAGDIENGQGSIQIIDNGVGMSLQTIQSAWMEPATHIKRVNTRSELFRRRVLGEKGIGRFAASRLADSLLISTRQPDADKELSAFVDWTAFDDESKYLDEIEILWETNPPSEFADKGSFTRLLTLLKIAPIPKDGMALF